MKLKATNKAKAANKQVTYNVHKLKDENVHKEYNIELQNRFEELAQMVDVEDEWENIRERQLTRQQSRLLAKGGEQRRRDGLRTWKSIDERRLIKAKKEQIASTGGDAASVTEEYRQKDKEGATHGASISCPCIATSRVTQKIFAVLVE